MKERVLHLVRWTPEAGYLGKGGHAKEMLVRVLSFPLHLWSRLVFKKIGDECGGFVAVDEDTTLMTNLHWARILVHPVGSSLPSSLQLVMGKTSFFLQFWWEALPGFSFVEPRRRNCVASEQEVGGGVEVSSCVDEASGMGMHPLSTVAVVELLCCRSEAAEEGVAGFDAKAVAVGLTSCRLRLVGEATVDSAAIFAEGRGEDFLGRDKRLQP